LASVMEQAAVVADIKGDPRHEAAWRLKSLATHLAALGQNAKPPSGGGLHWEKVADSIGGALLDLARLDAMLDRVGKNKAAQGCEVSVAAAQLREAVARLDHCRMRSACVGRGSAATTVKAADGGTDIFERAKAAADQLIVNEISDPQNQTVQVA